MACSNRRMTCRAAACTAAQLLQDGRTAMLLASPGSGCAGHAPGLGYIAHAGLDSRGAGTAKEGKSDRRSAASRCLRGAR